MDGLVTNVSLIAGVSGGGVVRHAVILSGWAGLVAGAFSMATGEFTSVKSQNEMVESETAVEREGLAAHPREERAELAASLVQRGVAPALAEEVAAQMSENPDEALRFHAAGRTRRRSWSTYVPVRGDGFVLHLLRDRGGRTSCAPSSRSLRSVAEPRCDDNCTCLERWNCGSPYSSADCAWALCGKSP